MGLSASRRTLQILLLAGLLALAGCTAYTGEGVDRPSTPVPTTSPPAATTTQSSSPTPHESYFVFQNTWNAPATTADSFTYTVTLYVAEEPVTAYAVTTSDGRTSTYDGSIPPRESINATAVAPAEVLHTETYTVAPQSTLYVGIENMTDEQALIYNYHSPRSSGIGFNQATEGNTSTGPWYIRIKPGASHVSVGGEYTQQLSESTISHTITLNESHTTTE